MAGRRRPAQHRPCGRDEAVQEEGGLPRPRRPGQPGQPVDREGGGEVVQVVEVADLDRDLPAGIAGSGRSRRHGRGPGQERSDDQQRFRFQLRPEPCAITVPPLAPAAGPELDDPVGSADDSRSCSTTITELPFPASALMILRSPATLLRCSPTDGSSSTYSMPVVLARTVEVSSIRCRSPVDSEAPPGRGSGS